MALDADEDGRLSCSELLRFARLTGCDDDVATWQEEYESICIDLGVCPSEGLNRKSFAALVDVNSEFCPCTNDDLQGVFQLLPPRPWTW